MIQIINRNHKMFPKGWGDKVDITENWKSCINFFTYRRQGCVLGFLKVRVKKFKVKSPYFTSVACNSHLTNKPKADGALIARSSHVSDIDFLWEPVDWTRNKCPLSALPAETDVFPIVTSSEAEGKSVRSGEKARRKISTKGGRAPGYWLSPDNF